MWWRVSWCVLIICVTDTAYKSTTTWNKACQCHQTTPACFIACVLCVSFALKTDVAQRLRLYTRLCKAILAALNTCVVPF
jgi:hypothetical protein